MFRKDLIPISHNRPSSLIVLSRLLDEDPKDIEDDIHHLFKSLKNTAYQGVILPATCRKCGNFVFDQVVSVRVKETDRYGRSVAEVFLEDGRSLNRELVRAGLAWWYRRYSKDASLGVLEQAARENRVGLGRIVIRCRPGPFGEESKERYRLGP